MKSYSKKNEFEEITELKLPWGTVKIGPGTVPTSPHGAQETDINEVKKAMRELSKLGIWDSEEDYYGSPKSSLK